MSLPDISKEYSIPISLITFMMDYYEIPTRSLSESAKKITVPKNTERNMKLYGTTNVLSKGAPGYDKKIETVKKKYGVDNVFKSEEIKQKLLDDSIWLQRYGMTRKEYRRLRSKEAWNRKTDEEKEKWLNNALLSSKCRDNMFKNNNYTKIEKIVQEYIEDMGITFKKQFCVSWRLKEENRYYYYYDLYLPEYNIIIEVNGDYWHANPSFYKKNDIVNYPEGEVCVSTVWERDKKKIDAAKSLGYIIIVIWQEELKELNGVEDFTYLFYNKIEEVQNEISKDKEDKGSK